MSFYREYLNSSAWRAKREEMLELAGYQCEECGSGGHLHVHHLTYARLGREELDDLAVLCPQCHEAAHL